VEWYVDALWSIEVHFDAAIADAAQRFTQAGFYRNDPKHVHGGKLGVVLGSGNKGAPARETVRGAHPCAHQCSRRRCGGRKVESNATAWSRAHARARTRTHARAASSTASS
jgi:hypothetical protein